MQGIGTFLQKAYFWIVGKSRVFFGQVGKSWQEMTDLYRWVVIEWKSSDASESVH